MIRMYCGRHGSSIKEDKLTSGICIGRRGKKSPKNYDVVLCYPYGYQLLSHHLQHHFPVFTVTSTISQSVTWGGDVARL
jgi:hypothetical protein